jgi:hypothetical protein
LLIILNLKPPELPTSGLGNNASFGMHLKQAKIENVERCTISGEANVDRP